MIESGIITLWFGAIVNIPAGWVICDGNNGTPDLRSNFVVGAGLDFDVDQVGGAIQHAHTFTGDGHFHSLGGGPGELTGVGRDDFTSTDVVTGSTDPAGNLPPFHALAYIMKT